MTLPSDVDLEARYLGTVLADPDTLDRWPVQVTELTRVTYQMILGAMIEMRQRAPGMDLAPQFVEAELRRQGRLDAAVAQAIVDVAKLIDTVPGTTATRLRELATLRRIRELAMQVQVACESRPLTEVVPMTERLAEFRDPETTKREAHARTVDTVRAAMQEVVDADDRRKRGTGAQCTTGSWALDCGIGGGLEAGDLLVIGGDTSVGKSTTALYMAIKQARAGRKPGIVSVEDPRARWGRRVLSLLSGVPIRLLRDGELNQAQWTSVMAAGPKSAEIEIHFSFNIGAELREVTDAIRMLIREHGCDVIYLDYLQAVEVNAGLETREKMRRILSAAKRECNLVPNPPPLIVLSQFRKRDDETQEPTRADLYESNYIAQKAEGILLLWKADGAVHGVVDKSKDEATGTRIKFTRDKNGHLQDESEDPEPHPADTVTQAQEYADSFRS